ncbi:MAG: rhamnose ABC transporter substrate-binding protein [Desulfobacteraceae bacterium]|nr:rhamnose ABC transporter substrate-binding protein [Desulfobacteraceae bacterium]
MKKNFTKLICLITLVTLAISGSAFAADKLRVALVVKSLGNGFFEAARDGAVEASKELGVEIIYTGPAQATAEGQIEIINSLIAQKVDAIAISANDPNALIPITKKAMKRGIKVISWDSGIAPGGRSVDLIPANVEGIGKIQIKMVSDTIGNKGDIAILSATAQATNQNLWIEAMKNELNSSEYSNLNLVSVVYGDDKSDKSYREALGLFKTYPNLKGIIAPTTVGILASAKAVKDQGLKGKIYVTGLGLPSEMTAYVMDDVVDTFAIWNPIDLGYSAAYICHGLIKGDVKGEAGEEIAAGRMGKIKVGKDGVAVMGLPFVYNKSNVEKFSKIF